MQTTNSYRNKRRRRRRNIWIDEPCENAGAAYIPAAAVSTALLRKNNWSMTSSLALWIVNEWIRSQIRPTLCPPVNRTHNFPFKFWRKNKIIAKLLVLLWPGPNFTQIDNNWFRTRMTVKRHRKFATCTSNCSAQRRQLHKYNETKPTKYFAMK